MKATLVMLACVWAVSAAPRATVLGRRAEFTLQNGKDALALNEKFKTLSANAACNTGETACVNKQFAQCVNGKFVLQPCAGGLECVALPLVNSAGTSITCDTIADRDARIAATGATAAATPAGQGNAGNGAGAGKAGTGAGQNNAGNGAGAGNAGTGAGQNNAGNGAATGNNGGAADASNTLDPSVIAQGSNNDGTQGEGSEAGVAPSLKSGNNFINFCAGKTITNGKQVEAGSCNPIPMGQLPAKDKVPSSKFQFPVNLQKIKANEPFTIKMAIQNLDTGFFTNAKQTYYSAPQQLNGQGIIQGHSHVVIEQVESLTATAPLNPNVFAFFLGLNTKAANGVLSANVKDGLKTPGIYRLGSINAAANHQPVLAPIAQHGILDDVVYFEITA